MKIGRKFKKGNDVRYMNGIRIASYNKVNQRMSKFEYRILWTGLWIVFITALCFMFNSAAPLWLFILWFVGWQP